MLIPICTEKDSSLALSIVESKEGYSVVPCSIVNGYGMAPLPSYMAGMEKFTTEMGTTVEPIASFDYWDKEVEGKDLKDCINKVMKSLGSDHENVLPLNVPNEKSLMLLMDSDDKMCMLTSAYVVDNVSCGKIPNFLAIERSEDYHVSFFFIHDLTVTSNDFYKGLEEVMTLIKEKFN